MDEKESLNEKEVSEIEKSLNEKQKYEDTLTRTFARHIVRDKLYLSEEFGRKEILYGNVNFLKYFRLNKDFKELLNQFSLGHSLATIEEKNDLNNKDNENNSTNKHSNKQQQISKDDGSYIETLHSYLPNLTGSLNTIVSDDSDKSSMRHLLTRPFAAKQVQPLNSHQKVVFRLPPISLPDNFLPDIFQKTIQNEPVQSPTSSPSSSSAGEENEENFRKHSTNNTFVDNLNSLRNDEQFYIDTDLSSSEDELIDESLITAEPTTPIPSVKKNEQSVFDEVPPLNSVGKPSLPSNHQLPTQVHKSFSSIDYHHSNKHNKKSNYPHQKRLHNSTHSVQQKYSGHSSNRSRQLNSVQQNTNNPQSSQSTSRLESFSTSKNSIKKK
ncbi:hypothetical protein SNEBB_005458 [Seison nebaliae]|nr:hypothetical protein SNEBB_005458 [Seison nebaliae]